MSHLVLTVVLAVAPTAAPDANDTCFACHADPALTLDLPTGEVRSMTVDAEVFAGSVHGARLSCTDCHPGHGDYPHPERVYRTLAEYRAPFREACKSCHFENYTRMVDSVHYKLLQEHHERGPHGRCERQHREYRHLGSSARRARPGARPRARTASRSPSSPAASRSPPAPSFRPAIAS
ncbi:MAG TPA: hypothetical protein VMT87_13265 [Vicinamibacteria bacterium]|nr:hypothetical protein [Vicinamibacteria bacterium]